MDEVSFKQRVSNELINGASIYKSVFIDYDYLIYSDAFKVHPYYIIGANEDNYQHLTGVNTILPPDVFFSKCLDGSLKETDFDFIKRDQSEKSVRGSIRRKIKIIPLISTLFQYNLQVEENFTKNKVFCSIATADNKMTIGFINATKAIPKTLLSGNELNQNNAVDVSLILRRNRNADKFDTIIKGDVRNFCLSFPDIYACNYLSCQNNHQST